MISERSITLDGQVIDIAYQTRPGVLVSVLSEYNNTWRLLWTSVFALHLRKADAEALRSLCGDLEDGDVIVGIMQPTGPLLKAGLDALAFINITFAVSNFNIGKNILFASIKGQSNRSIIVTGLGYKFHSLSLTILIWRTKTGGMSNFSLTHSLCAC